MNCNSRRLECSIGMIGAGWVNGSYAKDFIARGFNPVCYSLDERHVKNKEKIQDCDFVFIAVPTPTTAKKGFDDSILRSVVKLVGEGKSAVIKSTVIPGTIASLQQENQGIYIIHCPEFLNEVTAEYDAAHPERNIIGIPKNTAEFHKKAEELLLILPRSNYFIICSSIESELIKYSRNCIGYLRIVFYNMLYDLAIKNGAQWKNIIDAISSDPLNGPEYTSILHKSGRGAGGNCFAKDFAAFTQYCENVFGASDFGVKMLQNAEMKNIKLLFESKKDIDKVTEIYGDHFAENLFGNK